MAFQKAIKKKAKLRLCIDGVSGSGKTFTSLAIASGMGGNIALIDTEHGSASLYADRFDFDSMELKSFQVEDYMDALQQAQPYEVLIIDSISHEWETLLERVDRIAAQKFGGNSFRAWGEGTPLQRKFIEAILNFPGHIIATVRSKTEYSVDRNEKGTTTIKKVGTAAVQRQGVEYEFSLAMTMDANHVGLITKDRTGKFQDKFIEKPGKEFGRELIAWLNNGEQDTAELCKVKMEEIGKILKTPVKGQAPFSPEEIEAIKNILRSFNGLPDKERLLKIDSVLEETKAEANKRNKPKQ